MARGPPASSEASASAIPVVAPRAGGVPGVVLPLETGLTYAAGDPPALRRAVGSVTGDRQRHLLDVVHDSVLGGLLAA